MFSMRRLLFLGSLLLYLGTQHPQTTSHAQPTATGPQHGKIVAMYYPDWTNYSVASFATAYANKVTHVLYAFINLDAAGNCIAPNKPSQATELAALKTSYPHLKLLFSVGGWTWSDNFSLVARDADKRLKMVNTCLSLMRQYGFDGIDFDWEYPVLVGETGNSVDAADGDNFVMLLSNFRQQMYAHELLTAATPASEYFFQHYKLAAMAEQLDFINLMSYAFSGAWERQTNHDGNLYPSAGVNSKLSLDYAVQTYHSGSSLTAGGVPLSKIVIGVGFWGSLWSNVPAGSSNGLRQPSVTMANITQDALATNWNSYQFSTYWDAAAHAAYAYNPNTQQWLSYEDQRSLCDKANYLKDNQLGGVMAWDVTADRDATLLGLFETCLTEQKMYLPLLMQMP